MDRRKPVLGGGAKAMMGRPQPRQKLPEVRRSLNRSWGPDSSARAVPPSSPPKASSRAAAPRYDDGNEEHDDGEEEGDEEEEEARQASIAAMAAAAMAEEEGEGGGGLLLGSISTAQAVEDLVEQLLEGVEAGQTSKSHVQQILVANLQVALAEETAHKIMRKDAQQQQQPDARNSTPSSLASKKLLSFASPEDCFAVERSKLLGDLESLHKIIAQKDADKARAMKKAADTERTLRQQVQGLRTRLEKAEKEKKQLEEALINQDAAIDRSSDKIGALRKDMRELKEAARVSANRHKEAMHDQTQAISRIQDSASRERRNLREMLEGMRLALQDEKVDWARERNDYLHALEEATRTVTLLESLAQDMSAQNDRLDEALLASKDGELDLVAALNGSRKQATDLTGVIQALRLELQKAGARHARDMKEKDVAMKALEERCGRAEDMRAEAEEMQSHLRVESVKLREQLVETAGQAAESLTLATAELQTARERVLELEGFVHDMRAQSTELLAFLERANQQYTDVATRLLSESSRGQAEDQGQWARVRAMQDEFIGMIKKMEENCAAVRERAEAAEEALNFYEEKDGYKLLAKEHQEALKHIAELKQKLARKASAERHAWLDTEEALVAEVDALQRDNTYMHDQLEAQACRPAGGDDSSRLDVVREVEGLLGRAMGLVGDILAPEEDDQDGEGRGNAAGHVKLREFGRIMAHVRRHLMMLEKRLATHEEERDLWRAFLEEGFGAEVGPLGDREREQQEGLEYLSDVLSSCLEDMQRRLDDSIEKKTGQARSPPGSARSQASARRMVGDESTIPSTSRGRRAFFTEGRAGERKDDDDKRSPPSPSPRRLGGSLSPAPPPGPHRCGNTSRVLSPPRPRSCSSSLSPGRGSPLSRDKRTPILQWRSSRSLSPDRRNKSPLLFPDREERSKAVASPSSIKSRLSLGGAGGGPTGGRSSLSPSPSRSACSSPAGAGRNHRSNDALSPSHRPLSPLRLAQIRHETSLSPSDSRRRASMKRLRSLEDVVAHIMNDGEEEGGMHAEAGEEMDELAEKLREKWSAVVTASKELERATEEAQDLRFQVKRLEEEKEAMGEENGMLRQETERLQKYREIAMEAEGLRKEVTRVNSEKEALSRVVEALQSQIKLLNENQRRFEARAYEMESQAKGLEQEKGVLERDVERSEQERALYQDCVNLVTKEKETLAQEASRICRENEDLKDRVAALEAEQRRLQKEAQKGVDMQMRMEDLWTQHQILRLEADELRKVGQETAKEAAQLSGRIKMYEAGMESLLCVGEQPDEGRGRCAAASLTSRGQDLIGRVMDYVENVREDLQMKAEEAADLTSLRVALQLDLEAMRHDCMRYRECLIMLLEEVRADDRRHHEQLEEGEGDEQDRGEKTALEIVTEARLAVGLLQAQVKKEREYSRKADATAYEGCIKELLGLQDGGEEEEGMGSEVLCMRLRDHVGGLKRRAENLAKVLEESRATNAADRKRLQQEFVALRGQLEAWGRQGKELEAAALEVLHLSGPLEGGEGNQLAHRLRTQVGGLRRELDARSAELEQVKQDGQVSRRILEQEVREVKGEVEMLRRYCRAYEEAMYPLIGGAGEEGEESKGTELSVRLRDHVDSLKAQVASKVASLDELRREKALERMTLLEEVSKVKERASMYARMARSLSDAAKSVLGLEKELPSPLALGMGGEDEDKGEDEGGEEEEVTRLPVMVEEAKALTVKLRQWGARVEGEVTRMTDTTRQLERQIRSKDCEITDLKTKLRSQADDVSGLRAKAGGSAQEIASLRQKLQVQESDLSSLVTSMAKISDKLHTLQRGREGAARAACLLPSRRTIFHLQPKQDGDYGRSGGGGTEGLTFEGEEIRMAVTLLEQTLTREVEALERSRSSGHHHHHHHHHGLHADPDEVDRDGDHYHRHHHHHREEAQDTGLLGGSGGAQARRGVGARHEGLLAESEDPLAAILTRLADGEAAARRGGSGSTLVSPQRRRPQGGGELSSARAVDASFSARSVEALEEDADKSIALIERLEGELEVMRESKRGLMAEIKRLEQLVDEQSRTINGLASRNATLEIEMESLPYDMKKIRAERRDLERELERLRQDHEGREQDMRNLLVTVNKEKEKLQRKLRDQAHTIHQLTIQIEEAKVLAPPHQQPQTTAMGAEVGEGPATGQRGGTGRQGWR